MNNYNVAVGVLCLYVSEASKCEAMNILNLKQISQLYWMLHIIKVLMSGHFFLQLPLPLQGHRTLSQLVIAYKYRVESWSIYDFVHDCERENRAKIFSGICFNQTDL